MEVRLENWFLRREDLDSYQPPEAGFYCLVGDVYGHPKKTDGSHIATSRLLELSIADKKAVTNNTTYSLGKPDSSWASWLKNNQFFEVARAFDTE